MDKNAINSHDKFFKKLFSDKEIVSEFIEKTLPENLTKNLQLDTLELDKNEYVDSKLRTNFSDIVYNCRYGDGIFVKISLLFEHKSYPEAYPHFQLLSYMLKIWQRQIEQKQDLTPVIPIIFYHGQQKWKHKKLSDYFRAIDENIQAFMPEFEYLLVDTSDYSDEQLQRLFESI